MKLTGKVALITGGGTGIGRAVAEAFANEGAQVIITGRRADKLQSACDSISAEPSVQYRAVDVADLTQVQAAVQWATDTFGRVDILVNNAGVNVVQRKIAEITPESWETIMRINATGAFNTIHALLPQMIERQDGVIINVSSLAGVRAGPLGGAAYSASKHAMCALTSVISQEQRENGIRATNLCPGEVNTPILDERPVPVSDAHKAQILQPEDVATAALFIATLPPRAHVPELWIKPTTQQFA